MTALVILAAGESARLGRPKQNFAWQGRTLLARAAAAGLASECASIIVVLGANAEKIKPVPDTATLYNKDWQEGMASSIRLAIGEIDKVSLFEQVIIMVCDQPFVDSALVNALIERRKETGKAIIAAAYNDTLGVPALFDKSLFTALLQLKGKEGAKKIIKNFRDLVSSVPFEKRGIDIDTPEDYERLLNSAD